MSVSTGQEAHSLLITSLNIVVNLVSRMSGMRLLFWNSIQGFVPAASRFAHCSHYLYPEDYTLISNSDTRSSHNTASGHWLLRSSNFCLLWSMFYPKPVWSDGSQVHAELSIGGAHQRCPISCQLSTVWHLSMSLWLVVGSREGVVIFSSLISLRGCCPFNYLRVSEERGHCRGIIHCATSKVITFSSRQLCKVF